MALHKTLMCSRWLDVHETALCLFLRSENLPTKGRHQVHERKRKKNMIRLKTRGKSQRNKERREKENYPRFLQSAIASRIKFILSCGFCLSFSLDDLQCDTKKQTCFPSGSTQPFFLRCSIGSSILLDGQCNGHCPSNILRLKWTAVKAI